MHAHELFVVAVILVSASAVAPSELHRPRQVIGRGSFEGFALGHTDLCNTRSNRSYHCLRGADRGQSGPPSSIVVGPPEPIRSGKRSLRSGPFNFSQGYRVEVIPANLSEPSEGDVIEDQRGFVRRQLLPSREGRPLPALAGLEHPHERERERGLS